MGTSVPRRAARNGVRVSPSVAPQAPSGEAAGSRRAQCRTSRHRSTKVVVLARLSESDVPVVELVGRPRRPPATGAAAT